MTIITESSITTNTIKTIIKIKEKSTQNGNTTTSMKITMPVTIMVTSTRTPGRA